MYFEIGERVPGTESHQTAVRLLINHQKSCPECQAYLYSLMTWAKLNDPKKGAVSENSR